MKKAWIIIAVLAVIAGVTYLAYTGFNYSEWQRYVEINTIHGYGYYIMENPKSKYIDDAIQAADNILMNNLDDIDVLREYMSGFPYGENIDLVKSLKLEYDLWQEVTDTNTISVYALYITENPTSKYIDDAAQKANDLLKNNPEDIDIVERYTILFPDGEYIDFAKDKLEDCLWANSLDANITDLYQAYIYEYPNGKYVQLAHEKIDDINWGYALTEDHINGYESYISKYPNGKYVKLANDKIEDLEWNDALNDNYIGAFESYISQYPKGKYIQLANDKLKVLREAHESELWTDAMQGNLYQLEAYISEYPNGKHINEAKKIFEGTAITTLMSQNKISAVITGIDINKVSISMTNLTDTPLMVVLPLGTWFGSQASYTQNMLLTHEVRLYLPSKGTENRNVGTACMNIDRGIPYSEDSFNSVNYLGDDALLTKVIKALNDKGAYYSVVQAAVWRITDNASTYDLTHTLRSGFGGFGPSVISEEDVVLADEIIASVK